MDKTFLFICDVQDEFKRESQEYITE